MKQSKTKREPINAVDGTMETFVNKIVNDERKLFLEVLDQVIDFAQTNHANVVIDYAKACKKILKVDVESNTEK